MVNIFNILKKISGKDNEYVKLGNEKFDMGKYLLAMHYYKLALNINKNNKDALEGIKKSKSEIEYNKAYRSYFSSKYSLAKRILEKSIEEHPYEKSINLLNNIYFIEENIAKIIKLKRKIKEGEFKLDYIREIAKYCKNILNLNKNDEKAYEMYKEMNILLNKLKEINNLIENKEYKKGKILINKLKNYFEKYSGIINYLNSLKKQIITLESKKKFKKAMELYHYSKYYEALKILEEIKSTCETNKSYITLYNNTTSILEYVNQYEKYFKEGNYELAKTCLNNILEIDSDTKYLIELDIISEIIEHIQNYNKYMKKGEYILAIKECREILKLNPDDENIKNKLNEIYDIYYTYIDITDSKNYKEIFERIKPLIKYNENILYNYLDKLKSVILNYENNIYENIKIISYYINICGGTGLKNILKIDNEIIKIKYLKKYNSMLIYYFDSDNLNKLTMSYIDLNSNTIVWTRECLNEHGEIYQVNKNIVIIYKSIGIVEYISTTNGKLLWEYETLNKLPINTLLYSDVYLYLGCDYGHIYKLNLNDGSEKSNYKLPKNVKKIIYCNDKNLIVVCGNSNMLNSEWNLYKIYNVGESLYVGWSTSVKYVKDISYCGKYDYIILSSLSDNSLTVINNGDGKKVWKKEFDKNISNFKINYNEEIIIINTNDDKGEIPNCDLYGLSVKNGNKIWHNHFKGETFENIILKKLPSCNENNCLCNETIIVADKYNNKKNTTLIYFINSDNGNITNKFRAYGKLENIYTTENCQNCPKKRILSILYKNPKNKKITNVCFNNSYVIDNYYSIHNIDLLNSVIINHNSCNTICVCTNEIILFDNSKSIHDIILSKIIESYDIFKEYLLNNVNKLNNISYPLMNKIYVNKKISKIISTLEKKDLSSSLIMLEELLGYMDSCKNNKLNVELNNNVFEKDIYTPVKLKIHYVNGVESLYNVSVLFTDGDVKTKNINKIDVLHPSETKYIEFLALPLYGGKYPVEITITAEDKEGNPLESYKLTEEIEVLVKED